MKDWFDDMRTRQKMARAKMRLANIEDVRDMLDKLEEAARWESLTGQKYASADETEAALLDALYDLTEIPEVNAAALEFHARACGPLHNCDQQYEEGASK